MKVFWCSLAVFALLLAGIVVNCIYVNRTVKQLNELTGDIPDSPEQAEEAVARLSGYWEEQKDWLGISVSYTELNKVDDLITSIRSAQECKSEMDFLRDRARLFPAIEEISRLEQLKIWNIF